jgi:hypothetical protein
MSRDFYEPRNEAMPRTAHDMLPGDGFSTAQARKAAHADAVGHGSVQPWSAGPLFPCVIATVERYETYQPFEAFRHYQDAYGWSDEETRRNYEGCRDTWYALRSLESRLLSVSYMLFAYGRREEYATREDAEQVARALNSTASMRAAWQRGAYEGDQIDQRARDAGAL